MSSDHELAFEFAGHYNHPDALQEFDQPNQQDVHTANIFLKLSSLQFDLQRQRDQLMAAGLGHNDIT